MSLLPSNSLKRGVVALAFLLVAGGAALAAEEPSGCDKFAWNVDKVRALLLAPETAPAGPLDRDMAKAVTLSLVPLPQAKLAMPPERASKEPNSDAGSVEFKAAAAGTYLVTLSAGAWIDVVQGGAYLKPLAFTGARDCAGVRKSVKFRIGADAFTLQVSGVPADSIGLAITPAN